MHHDISNQTKLILSDNKSVVLSSINVDSARQNQKQMHDDLTNSNHSHAIKISENDKVSIDGG